MTKHGSFWLSVLLCCFAVGATQGWAQLQSKSDANRPANLRLANSSDSVDAPQSATYTDQWAIIIGVDQYQAGGSDLKDLEFAVNDAREFKELLVNEFGYQEDHIVHLSDRGATGKSVVNAFAKWLPEQQPKETDSVLVFFAGHGLIKPETKDGFLACVDCREDNIKGTCLPVTWVRKQLSQLPCKHKLVILDSCFSGILFRGQNERSDRSADADSGLSLNGSVRSGRSGQRQSFSTGNSKSRPADNFTYYLQNSAYFGMTAGRETPVADGLGANKHSVFTAALLRVMRERADSPRADHAFTFRQLAASVERLVTSAAGSEQIPDWRRLEDGQGDFVFRPQFRRKTPSEISAERQSKSEWQLYAMQIASAKREWDAGNVEKAWSHLNSCRWDFRGWEHDYLMSLFQGKQIGFDGHTGTVLTVAFSPNEQSIVTAGLDNTARIWSLSDGESATLTGHEGQIESVVFTPDGKRVITGSRDSTIKTWDAHTGKNMSTIKAHNSELFCLALSPDGTLIASGGSDRFQAKKGEPQVKVWNANTESKSWHWPDTMASSTVLISVLVEKRSSPAVPTET